MTVARIEVVLAVPREAELLEEVLAKPVEASESIVGAPRGLRRAAASAVEAREVRGHVEIGLVDRPRSGGRRGRGGSGRPGDPPPRRMRPATESASINSPGAWWMPAVRSAAPCSSSASASVRAETRRAASCVLRRGGQLEQERAAELVVEALVRLDDFAVERRGESVARAVAELDELAVLDHRDRLAGELAGGHPLDRGRRASRGTEERARIPCASGSKPRASKPSSPRRSAIIR